ncbi:hypothetical protein EVAR_96007_1 [Eumeta japonica]|uniref:Delta(24)-sterol reductase n=1 Tax=Eumeta variegata TaxID=151549 RepID=A0A4C1XF11_EUMVA|nr:hypothetical protein EVAR_96007_1 [Eumeta japonica]
MDVQTENLTEYILVHYRWILVLFLLPMSAIWKVYSIIRNYLVFKLNSAPKLHDKKVKNVQKQIKKWHAAGRGTRLCTARPTWQTMSFRQGVYKKSFTNIEVNLVDVLEVDKENMTVRCEPLVTMGQLSRTLAPLGLALAVVPELDQLTVGGLVMGTGVESSSHIHGLFQHICLEYELVLADGSVVKCSKDENVDLFYAVPWSYGTLGFLTSVVIRYVRLEYHPHANLSSLVNHFSNESLKRTPHQFIEGLLFSVDSGVVMLGDMVEEMGDDGAKAFERKLTNPVVEYIPLRDYYHRHTRSLFWELQEFLKGRSTHEEGIDGLVTKNVVSVVPELTGFDPDHGDIIPFGNNPLFRHTLGWLMPPEVSLLKLTQTEAVGRLYERCHVIQDMLVPIENMKESIEVFHQEFQVYPMWLCPFKLFNQPGQLKATTTGEWQMFVDIGVYGVPKAEGYETVPSTRRVEAFVTKKKGFQMLYADTYTTLEEFRAMFDHALYDKVRQTLPYCTEAFPEIYGKVNRSVRK